MECQLVDLNSSADFIICRSLQLALPIGGKHVSGLITACGNSGPRAKEKSDLALSLGVDALLIKQNGI